LKVILNTIPPELARYGRPRQEKPSKQIYQSGCHQKYLARRQLKSKQSQDLSLSSKSAQKQDVQTDTSLRTSNKQQIPWHSLANRKVNFVNCSDRPFGTSHLWYEVCCNIFIPMVYFFRIGRALMNCRLKQQARRTTSSAHPRYSTGAPKRFFFSYGVSLRHHVRYSSHFMQGNEHLCCI
jgi:hypothetical protein